MAEKVMVTLDVAACAHKYRTLAAAYEEKANIFWRATEGVRMTGDQAILKGGEYGSLVGKQLAYEAVAKQFEHLVKSREEGRI